MNAKRNKRIKDSGKSLIIYIAFPKGMVRYPCVDVCVTESDSTVCSMGSCGCREKNSDNRTVAHEQMPDSLKQSRTDNTMGPLPIITKQELSN